MIRTQALIAVVTASLVAAATGCSLVTAPPSIAPKMPRRSVIPRSYKMKLAVFNLQDPTRSGGRLSESIAETLHVALFETERFELMQRAELRGVNPDDTERIRRLYRDRLDGLVVGSITHFNTAQKTVTLNINVMNPFGTTMAAKSWENIPYTGAINVDVNREDIREIAHWIDSKFPRLESGRVLSRSSDRITINLGSEHGVQVGMWVLIAARGDDVKDPATGELLGSDIYVGEAYVVAVHPGSCEAALAPIRVPHKRLDGQPVMFNGQPVFDERMPHVRVSDKIIFK